LSSEILMLSQSIAKEHAPLAHQLRVTILAIVLALGRASWSDIKYVIERIYGSVNPNTLAFHIRKLIDAGYLKKSGSMETPIYEPNVPEDVAKKLEPLVAKVKELIRRGEVA